MRNIWKHPIIQIIFWISMPFALMSLVNRLFINWNEQQSYEKYTERYTIQYQDFLDQISNITYEDAITKIQMKYGPTPCTFIIIYLDSKQIPLGGHTKIIEEVAENIDLYIPPEEDRPLTFNDLDMTILLYDAESEERFGIAERRIIWNNDEQIVQWSFK